MDSNFFKERREELKLTQREVSIDLGITESTIRNWEGFKTCPHLSMVAELARVYRSTRDAVEKAILECAREITRREARLAVTK